MITISRGRRGRTKAEDSVELDTEVAEGAAEPSTAGVETWTRRTDLVRKATTAVMCGAMICGPAALIWRAVDQLRPAEASAVQVVSSAASLDERGRVSMFARDAVVVWLTATRDQDALLKTWLPAAEAPKVVKAPKVSEPLVVSADQVAEHQWSVRVAVSVNGQRQYLQLPVIYSPTTKATSAAAMPQPVAGVTVGSRPAERLEEQFPVTSDLGKTLSGFVSAFAAGQGDITRYTAPGTELDAITPVPYRSVRITALRSDFPIPLNRAPNEGGAAQVMISAEALTADKFTQKVSWVVTVKVRAGRWEVASLDSMPGVRTSTPSMASPTGTTPDQAVGTSAPSRK